MYPDSVCDNASVTGTNIGIRQCHAGVPMFRCTVDYGGIGDIDILYLCASCTSALQEDVEKYRFTSEVL